MPALLPRFLAAVVVAVLATHVSHPAAQAPAAAWTPELMLTVKRVPAVVPSPDGTQVAFVVGDAVTEGERSEWVNQIHLAAADGSGSRQLTRGEKSSSDPRWSPDGKSLAFISSRNGKANIWRIDVSGGEAEMITDEKGGISALEWAPDGASLAFVMKDAKTETEEKADKEKRDWRTLDEQVKMNRLYVVPLAKGADGKRKARVLTSEARSVNDFSWAPDGKTIVFEHQKTPAADDWPSDDLSVVTVADGTVTALAASTRAEEQPVYSPDGQFIAFAISVDPPTWATERRVQVVPAKRRHRAGAGGHAGRAAEHRGLVERRAAAAGQRDPRPLWPGHGAARRRQAGHRARRRRLDQRAHPQPHRNGAGVRRPGRRPRAGAAGLVASARRSRRSRWRRVQPSFTAPLGRSEPLTWKSPDGRSIEGLLTYPVGYAPGTQGAAAARHPRRPGRRLRPQLRRHARPVPDRRVRRPRLRRAARQPARQQRLRQGLPPRQPRRLGRRRLSRPDERRRSRDRDGRGRSGPAGRDGLELRRLHDVVGRHADDSASRPRRRARR